MKKDLRCLRVPSKFKIKDGTNMYPHLIFRMPMRPELSTSTRYRSRMLLLTEVPHLGRVQCSGQGFDEKKERTATDVFFRFPRSFSTQQTGEAGHNVDTALLRGRSPLCGQYESVIGKTNVYVDTKSV